MNLPLHPSCRVVTRHEFGLLAVEKPNGILSHPNSPEDRDFSLLGIPYDMEDECYRGEDGAWFLLNRLDRPTSGLILLAENSAVAGLVRDAFARHVVEKTYIALVKGFPRQKTETWKDCLSVEKRGSSLRVQTVGGRPNAETNISLLKLGQGPPARSLLELAPVTGKTHQLRVQCAARHLPIIGDATYGDFTFNRAFRKRTGENRLFLHSHRIRMPGNIIHSNEDFMAESPLPGAFTVALD